MLRRLCDLVVRRQVDAVALIGPAATKHLLEQATRDGTLDDLLNTFVEHVNAVCLGPLTAAPLATRGVPVVQAAEAVPESLVDATVLASCPGVQSSSTSAAIASRSGDRPSCWTTNSSPYRPGPLAVLRALAARPGRVLSAAEIRASMPGSSTVDDHAIEMSVSRLRSTVGPGLDGVELVQTVMKRGYRLAV